MGVIGDSHSAVFTDFCQELGWQGEGTNFDVLPLVFLWMEKHLYIKKFRKRSKRSSN